MIERYSAQLSEQVYNSVCFSLPPFYRGFVKMKLAEMARNRSILLNNVCTTMVYLIYDSRKLLANVSANIFTCLRLSGFFLSNNFTAKLY